MEARTPPPPPPPPSPSPNVRRPPPPTACRVAHRCGDHPSRGGGGCACAPTRGRIDEDRCPPFWAIAPRGGTPRPAAPPTGGGLPPGGGRVAGAQPATAAAAEATASRLPRAITVFFSAQSRARRCDRRPQTAPPHTPSPPGSRNTWRGAPHAAAGGPAGWGVARAAAAPRGRGATVRRWRHPSGRHAHPPPPPLDAQLSNVAPATCRHRYSPPRQNTHPHAPAPTPTAATAQMPARWPLPSPGEDGAAKAALPMEGRGPPGQGAGGAATNCWLPGWNGWDI